MSSGLGPSFGTVNDLGLSRQPAGGLMGANNTVPTSYAYPNGLVNFFGPVAPGKGPLETNPYGPYRRENFSLPDAYKGSNIYMTNIIIQLITDDDMWPTRVALPFKFSEGEMEIVWDEIHFNNHLMGPVPEEGVSRLVTQQVSERRDHFVRYGIAFMLEHGFMRTEKGRRCYQMNLEQIRNAILETAYVGVIQAYFACKLTGQRFSQKYGARAGGGRLTLAQEVEDFACIQKTEHGFDLLDARAKRYMRSISIRPDMWILPEGTKMYLTTVRKENFDYFIKGPGGQAVYQSGLNQNNGSAIDVANDCMIFEAKTFEVANEAPVDVLARNAVIGEYYTMQNHLRGIMDPSKYRTSMRDIFVYNEEKDGFSRITLEQCLNTCHRFRPDSSGSLFWDTLDSDTDGNKGRWFGGSDGEPHDMFLHKPDGVGRVEPTRWFGDMAKQHMRPEAVSDWTEHFYHKLAENHGKELFAALADGLALCREIDDNGRQTNNQQQSAWLTWLYLMETHPKKTDEWHLEEGLPRIPTVEHIQEMIRVSAGDEKTLPDKIKAYLDPETRMKAKMMGTRVGAIFDSDTSSKAGVPGEEERFNFTIELFLGIGKAATTNGLFDAFGHLQCQPFGYANWPGLNILARDEYKALLPKHHERAKNFVTAFTKVVHELESQLPSSFFLDPVYQPTWLKKRDRCNVLFANVFYPSTPFVFDLNYDTKLNHSTPVFANDKKPDHWIWGTKDGAKEDYQYFDFSSLKIDGFEQMLYLSDEAEKIQKVYNTNDMTAFKREIKNILWSETPVKDKPEPTMDGDERSLIEQATTILMSKIDSICGWGSRFGKKVTFNVDGDTIEGDRLDCVFAFLAALKEFKASVGPKDADRLTNIISNMHSIITYFLVEAENAYSAIVGFYVATYTLKKWTEDKKGGSENDRIEKVAKEALKKAFLVDSLQAVNKKYLKLDDPSRDPENHNDEVIRNHLKENAYYRKYKNSTVLNNVPSIRTNYTGVFSSVSEPYEGSVWGMLKEGVTVGDSTGLMLSSSGVAVDSGAPMGESAASGPSKRGARFGAEEDEDSIFAKVTKRSKNAEDKAMPTNLSAVDISDNMKKHWVEVMRETESVRKMARAAFLGTAVNYKSLLQILRSDGVFPFGFLLFRPYMTYEMASGILTVAGEKTGATFIGHADFQLGDNVVQKMHYGNYTMYLKSVVMQQQNVFIAENIFSQGYVCGNDTTFFKLNEARNLRPPQPGAPSLFSCLVPYDTSSASDNQYFCPELPNPIDITGRYSNNASLGDLKSKSNGNLHYATAPFYTNLYNWNNEIAEDQTQASSTGNRYNTMCFLGHHSLFNPSTQNFDLVIENTGHWGSRVYAGCGKVRKGMMKSLEPVSYRNTHGTSGTSNMVSIGY